VRRRLCVIAGDVSPLDVISHLPVLCEDNEVSYIYVASKESLGLASQTKRPTSCVLISAKSDSSLQKKVTSLAKDVDALPRKS